MKTILRNKPKKAAVITLPCCNQGNRMYKQAQLYRNSIKEFTGTCI